MRDLYIMALPFLVSFPRLHCLSHLFLAVVSIGNGKVCIISGSGFLAFFFLETFCLPDLQSVITHSGIFHTLKTEIRKRNMKFTEEKISGSDLIFLVGWGFLLLRNCAFQQFIGSTYKNINSANFDSNIECNLGSQTKDYHSIKVHTKKSQNPWLKFPNRRLEQMFSKCSL